MKNSNCACSEVPVLRGGEQGSRGVRRGGGHPGFVHVGGGSARRSWPGYPGRPDSVCALRESKQRGNRRRVVLGHGFGMFRGHRVGAKQTVLCQSAFLHLPPPRGACG